MALVVKDRVKETTATTGTGTLTLAGAVTGFQSFSSALSDGDTTYYAIFESSTGAWEVGLGTFTASGTTLARTTILASSNSGSAVNLTAGAAEVFITQPAGKAAYFDGSGDLNLTRDPQSALQAATKQYVDTIAAAGIHYHTPVRVESPSNLTATYDNGTAGVGATLTNSGTQAALVIDGITLSTSDRVLIYTQTNAAHNGIYTVTNTGSASTNWVLTRATDADSYGPSDPDALGEGDAFFVSEGDTGAGELYVMNTSGTITFGTTNINFAVIAETAVYSAGDGLTLTGTTFAVGAGTGVTVNANDIAIGQSVGTGDTVTFATVNANLTGNVTGNVSGSSGSTTGNAATATALQTGRTISLTGDVTGTSGTFDGTGNVSIAATIAADSVALGTDTTGNYIATGAVSGNGLSGSASAEGATFTVTSNATNANTASTIVFRDGSGNFSAGTITAALNGNATTATTATTANSVATNSVALGTDTTGNYVQQGATSGNGISGSVNSEGGTFTVTSNATNANTGSTIVFRDASGNFSAGTITANLTGTASSATNADTVDSLHASQFLRSDASDSTSGVLTSTSTDASGGIQVNTAGTAYFRADRGSTSNSAGYQYATNGTSYWWNYISTTVETLKWYSSASGIDVMTLTEAGSLATNLQGTLWGSSNDGSGSGLDADTVDGIQASSFLRSDADDSASGDITFTESIQVQSGGGSGNPIRIGSGFGSGGSATIHKYGAPLYLQYANGQTSTDVLLGGGGTTANLRMQGGYIDNISSAYVQDYIYHQGDTDTYMQFHAADSWRVVTGGTERLEATNSGIRIDDAFTLPTTDGSADQVLKTNGSGTVSWGDAGGGVASDYQQFTTSGTWTKPSDATWVYVEAIGGGGGGSGCAFAGDRAQGGGGGMFTYKLFRASDLGSTETVTIGSGGSGGYQAGGTDGGSSTFGSHLEAKGGKRGDRSGGPSAIFAGNFYTVDYGYSHYYEHGSFGGYGSGAYAAGPGGKTVYGGGGGGSNRGSGSGSGTPMAGGTSMYGGDGGAGGNSSTVPQAGTAPGGAGGGAYNSSDTGGAGAAGRIRVWSW